MVYNKSGHTFEDYPILKNHELLKQIHIKFYSLCQQVKKKSAEVIASPAPVYHLQDSSNSNHTDNEDDDDHYVFDFC